MIIAGIGLYRSRERRAITRQLQASGDAKKMRNGRISPEEAEAALTAGTPAPRPLMAREQQKVIEDEEKMGGGRGSTGR
jgi:hypothetical protein